MKHCPQCEFTFDDQQQVCDFDGTELSVVPERPPSFQIVKLAPAVSRSRVRRIVQSRPALAALALAGVLLSALLVGYYDSRNQPKGGMSNSQTRNDQARPLNSTQVDAVGQVETETDRPRIVSTQRRIGADQLPSSMVKRLLEGSGTRSAKLRRGPSSSKLVAIKRGPSSTQLMATKRKPVNVNKRAQARNRASLNSPERSRQQHGVANTRVNPRPVANFEIGNPKSETRSAHHRKDSKVIAVLKKTGSILKRPFELVADR